MKTITKFKKLSLVAVIAASTLLSGCLGASDGIHTRPFEEIKILIGEGRMYRGYVDFIVSDDKYQEMLAAHTDEQFKAASGMNKNEAKDKQAIAVTWHSAPGARRRNSLFVSKNWNLSVGDIVDYRSAVVSEEVLRAKEMIKGTGVGFIGNGIQYLTETEGLSMRGGEPPVVLSIVCRTDEKGCYENTSTETTIGIGRVLSSVEDYRGAEAESQQEMFTLGTNFGEFWGINVCTECEDEEKVSKIE